MLPAYAPYRPADPSDPRFAESAAGAERTVAAATSQQAPAAAGQPAGTPNGTLLPVWRGRVLLTLNQLSVMSHNGIEIADALEIVAGNCRDARLAHSLHQIHQAVNAGHSLSIAVEKYGTFFPTTLAPMLAAAEASGDVPQTLTRVCRRMRSQLQMRGTIIAAMIYPAILIGASAIVMCALILGVLPQFSKVFTSIGKPIPVHTQLLLSLGEFCRAHCLAIALVALATVVVLVLLRRSAIIRRPLGRLLMYGPLIREAYRPLEAGRVLRTIASMVEGGVPLLQAVQLSQRTTNDIFWNRLLQQIEAKLIDGLPASSGMTGVDFIPPETAQLMSTAERSGRVAEVLEDIGSFYEEEAERRIKRLVVTLEPAIIIVMGIMVAGIVMSVMLPLLDASTIGS